MATCLDVDKELKTEHMLFPIGSLLIESRQSLKYALEGGLYRWVFNEKFEEEGGSAVYLVLPEGEGVRIEKAGR